MSVSQLQEKLSASQQEKAALEQQVREEKDSNRDLQILTQKLEVQLQSSKETVSRFEQEIAAYKEKMEELSRAHVQIGHLEKVKAGLEGKEKALEQECADVKALLVEEKTASAEAGRAL